MKVTTTTAYFPLAIVLINQKSQGGNLTLKRQNPHETQTVEDIF